MQDPVWSQSTSHSIPQCNQNATATSKTETKDPNQQKVHVTKTGTET